MFFKNVTLFRFQEKFDLTPEALEQALARFTFRPVGNMEMSTFGFSSPFGPRAEVLTHTVAGCTLFQLTCEEKILPSSVVKQMVDEKATEIEDSTGQAVSRAQRKELAEQITFELIPRAFSRLSTITAYIDRDNNWLVINATSKKQIDLVTACLRKALESLPIEPLSPDASIPAIMTSWLLNALPGEGLFLQEECELREPGDEGGVVRARGVPLTSSEIRQHLDGGWQATKVHLNYADRMSFLLAEDFTLRRIKLSDLLQEPLADIDADQAAAKLDASFSIMSAELRLCVHALLRACNS